MRLFAILSAALSSLTLFNSIAAGQISSTQPERPKLIVGIVVDQFRYDYLTRFRSKYHGGLDQMLSKGAVFTNAYYQQSPTVTAVGHSIFMSGAMPSVSGIVGNSWYDREEETLVTSVCDWNEKTVGGAQATKGSKCTDADPASARRLLVTTVGDELKNASKDSKVIGVSIKARGAIMPSGHRSDGAYWFDDITGNFVSSTYFLKELPPWAQAFNDQKLASAYVDSKWDGFPKWTFRSEAGAASPYSKLPASPWGNELIERFAEQAIEGEKLGQRGATDLLTVSFSSNDYVGHAVGPDAPEVEDMAIRTDQLLEKLFKLIDEKIGLQNAIIVLSADHGVAPMPDRDEVRAQRRMPGEYLSASPENEVRTALVKRFGAKATDWLLPGGGETGIYFNPKAIEEYRGSDGGRIDRAELMRVAKQALLGAPKLHIARVYTYDELETGVTGDFVAQAMTYGFNPQRSGDLQIVYEPYVVPGSRGTTHFSPWGYDRHVPVLFYGMGIKPGRYNQTIAINDIAQTLATMLNIEPPSGSSGHVLTMMLQ
jgi:predicted AlkP superfamily pyrophosphatase or phosphodiesterase